MDKITPSHPLRYGWKKVYIWNKKVVPWIALSDFVWKKNKWFSESDICLCHRGFHFYSTTTPLYFCTGNSFIDSNILICVVENEGEYRGNGYDDVTNKIVCQSQKIVHAWRNSKKLSKLWGNLYYEKHEGIEVVDVEIYKFLLTQKEYEW